MAEEGSYPKHPRSTVNRYKKRGIYDYETIHTIVNNSLVCHVSFPPTTDDPFPALLPMIGVMGNFSDLSAPLSSPLDLYLHGYASSRIMKTAGSSANEDGSDEGAGLPVTIASTIVDGIILALTPNNHSYNYRSSVLQGYATVLPPTAIDEKLYAMKLITNNVVPGRWENTRTPPDKTEMTSTQILKVRVVSASAKVRSGSVHDEKKDLRTDEVREKVWTGVVPVWERFGVLVPDEGNRVGEVPGYLREWVEGENKKREGEAVDAMMEPE